MYMPGHADFANVNTPSTDQFGSFSWNGAAISNSGRMDVSQYESITISAAETGGQSLLSVVWYLFQSSSLHSTVATQYIVLDKYVSNGITIRLPCLSGNVEIFCNGTVNVNAAGSGVVLLSQASSPVTTFPQVYSKHLWTGNIAAGASETVYPDDYMSGPCTASLYSDTGDVYLEFFYYDTSLAVLSGPQLFAPSAGWYSYEVNLPPSAWFATVYNAKGAAQSVKATITASSTGG